MNAVALEDFERICQQSSIPWERLKGRTITITGATGVLGSNLAGALLYAGQRRNLDVTVVALARNTEQAALLQSYGGNLKILPYHAEAPLQNLPETDYFIHTASPTASRFFVEHPVETLSIPFQGTKNALEYARTNALSGFLYLSSMEVYGRPPVGTAVREEDVFGFDPFVPRNSYPIGKIACEALCCAYASEYGIPANVLRLTQTFGPGVGYQDTRVFAEFMRCVIEQRDIILHTPGRTERSYLYTSDAVSAILSVLLKGERGHIYTAANPETYCSILEMAELVAAQLTGGRIRVRVEAADDLAAFGYADELHMNLDVSKLTALGWVPQIGLEEAFRRLIAGFQTPDARREPHG